MAHKYIEISYILFAKRCKQCDQYLKEYPLRLCICPACQWLYCTRCYKRHNTDGSRVYCSKSEYKSPLENLK